MKKSAEMVLGWEKRRQPDCIDQLGGLIQKRNALFARWLKTRCDRDRQSYVNQRREVAREVQRAKNEWFQRKAREVERGMRGGRGAWKGLREIQRGRAGLRSVKTRAIKDRDGELCIGQDNTLRRWHEHFESVLNINSSFDESVIHSAQQHPLRNELMQLHLSK